MPLKIRRGTDGERAVITPAEGELIYATDTKKVWVGDGSTAGGNEVTGDVFSVNGYSGTVVLVTDDISEDGSPSNLWHTTERAQDAASQLFDHAGHSGITFVYNDVAGIITATVDADAVGFGTVSVSGQSDVIANDDSSTLTLAAGTGISITTDAGTDTVTITNTSLSNGTVTSSPANLIAFFPGPTAADVVEGCASTAIALNPSTVDMYVGDDTRAGSINVTTSDADPTFGVANFRDADGLSAKIGFFKSRGTTLSPTAVQVGDELGRFAWGGYGGGVGAEISGCYMVAKVTDTVDPTYIPAKIEFYTTNPAGTTGLALTIDDDGTLQIGNVLITSAGLDTEDSAPLQVTPAATFLSDVTVENDLTVSNNVTAGTVYLTSGPLRLANMSTAARDTIIAQNGDMIYNTDTNAIQAYQNGAWVQLTP